MFTIRRLFLSLGGFHSSKFADQYFDIDYCLRVGGLVAPSAPVAPPPSSINTRVAETAPSPSPALASILSGASTFGSSATGLRVIYDPHAVYYHYTSGIVFFIGLLVLLSDKCFPDREEALTPGSADATSFASKWSAHPTLRALVDRWKQQVVSQCIKSSH